MYEINLNNVQLQDLELFLAVADTGNFTKAGEKLYVTQSWVSKRMNFLEQELGLQLFLRNRNRMSLTPAGRPQIGISDLKSQDILMLHEHCSIGYNEFVKEVLYQEKIRPMVSHYASSGREHIANLIFGRGILIASSYFLGNEFEGMIKGIPIEGLQTFITAIWKKENNNSVIPRLLSAIRKSNENG